MTKSSSSSNASSPATSTGSTLFSFSDEITSALDPELKGEVLAVLEDLKREGLTLVVVTHNREISRVADRVMMFDQGIIMEEDSPDVIFHNPSHERTQRFLQQLHWEAGEEKDSSDPLTAATLQDRQPSVISPA